MLTTITIPLPRLIDECQAQIAAFKRRAPVSNSPSCGEIVRRAAARDEDALAALLAISRAIIEQKVGRKFADQVEDIIQEVNVRLVRKFHHPNSPYQASGFPQYHDYLNITLKHVIANLIRRAGRARIDDEVSAEPISDPQAAALFHAVERREIFQTILQQLPDESEREAVRRRYALGESVDEIVEAMQALAPGITKQRVYKLLEKALHRLRKNPFIKRFLDE